MRRAVVHFLAAGALLFGAQHWLEPAAEPRQPPVTAAGDEDLLYRAALALRLDADDPVVQRRLIQNMRFLGEDGADDAALELTARRVGLDRYDPVVRRRLEERMRSRIRAATTVEPSDDELADYLARHADTFASPARVRLTQVFVAASAHAPAGERAAALRARLLAAGASADDATRFGDALPLPAHLASASRQDIANRFGDALAAAAMTLPVGEWSAPILSPYGAHLLWIHAREPGVPARLDDVRAAVRERLQRERGEAAVRAELARLRLRPPS